MGTTAEKIEYLNETKELIKQSLNDLGADIEDSNSFRSYVQKIKTLYEDWPKITAEGTSLSLNSTQKGKMKIELKGNALQNGTPTPDNPVNVNVVSGSNVIQINNKNLYIPTLFNEGDDLPLDRVAILQQKCTVTLEQDEFTFVATNTDMYFGNVAFSGTTFNGTQGCLMTIPTNATNIYIKLTNTAFSKNFITFYDKNKTSLSYGQLGATGNIAVVENAKYCTLRIGVGDSVSGTTYKTKVMVSASSITNYIAHQGQTLPLNLPSGTELCKIGDYQDYFYKSESKWYLHKECGKIVLDGITNTVGYNKLGNVINVGYKLINDMLAPSDNGIVGSTLNSHFTVDSINSLITNIKIGTGIRSDKLIILSFAQDENFETQTAINNWLQTNNITVFYVFSVPTNTEITDTTLISQLDAIHNAMSYKEQTNILQENDNLPFILNVSALQKE